MTTARKQIYDENEVGLYHCYSRCVRRAFLCGIDTYTNKNYEHRKEWLEELLEEAASRFLIDMFSFGILDNHFHVQLRNRPDLKDRLSPTGVARRWLLLHPIRRDKDGKPCEPNGKETREITKDPKRVKELRRRLCNISWFMGHVKEKLARQANKEDEVTGTFFEKRFQMKRLCSENAALACSVYIDLNEIHAGVAKTPETSTHSSIYLRLKGRAARLAGRKSKQALADRFLAPISQKAVPKNQRYAEQEWRASDSPGLAMTLEQYLELVDWTGRQLRQDKAGAIPGNLAPILERVGINTDFWLEAVKSFGAMFRRIAGDPEKVEAHAASHDRKWFHGINHCRRLFFGGGESQAET